MTRLILWAYSLLAWVFWLGTDSIGHCVAEYPNCPYAVSIQKSDCQAPLEMSLFLICCCPLGCGAGAKPCAADSSGACASALWLAPSQTTLVPFWAEALQRSPGSRACCFSACAGSPTTPDRLLARDIAMQPCCLPLSGKGRRPGFAFFEAQ